MHLLFVRVTDVFQSPLSRVLNLHQKRCRVAACEGEVGAARWGGGGRGVGGVGGLDRQTCTESDADRANGTLPAAGIATRRKALLVAAVNNIYSSHMNINTGRREICSEENKSFVHHAHFWIMHVGNAIQLHAGGFFASSLYWIYLFCFSPADNSTTEVIF